MKKHNIPAYLKKKLKVRVFNRGGFKEVQVWFKGILIYSQQYSKE